MFANNTVMNALYPFVRKFMSLMNQLVGICLYTDVFMCAQLLQLADEELSVLDMLQNKLIFRKLPLAMMDNLIYEDEYKFVLFEPLLVNDRLDPYIAIMCLLSLVHRVQNIIDP